VTVRNRLQTVEKENLEIDQISNRIGNWRDFIA
jgi:hypothetical protein